MCPGADDGFGVCIAGRHSVLIASVHRIGMCSRDMDEDVEKCFCHRRFAFGCKFFLRCRAGTVSELGFRWIAQSVVGITEEKINATPLSTVRMDRHKHARQQTPLFGGSQFGADIDCFR